VQETIFDPTQSPGRLTSEEGDRYEKAGIGELGRMLDWGRPKPPLEVQYVGVGLTQSYSLFAHDPTDFDGPYPNNISAFRGIEVALGVGEAGRAESSFFSHLNRLEGEFHLTFMRGRTTDEIDPDDFAIDDAVDRAEGEVNDEVDQGEKQVEGQINDQVEGQTGIDPKIDLNTEDVEFGPEDLGVDELRMKRRAAHTLGMINWRRLVWSRFSFFDDRLRLLLFYLNFGIGVMHTRTDVTKGSRKEEKSDTVILGRVTGEIDAVRLTGDDWLLSVRGGGGIIGGSGMEIVGDNNIGGIDLFLGAFLLRRF
ncbi:MAG: hypothetical protein HY542_04825, partial [Deltaproteobacteria bacterium]|nr:hypothetical protein [Deltaproteobacteria bacterium]